MNFIVLKLAQILLPRGHLILHTLHFFLELLTPRCLHLQPDPTPRPSRKKKKKKKAKSKLRVLFDALCCLSAVAQPGGGAACSGWSPCWTSWRGKCPSARHGAQTSGAPVPACTHICVQSEKSGSTSLRTFCFFCPSENIHQVL